MFNPVYIRQVELLLKVLPLIQKHVCFALKGGTAINLFVQNMPRLSVDIDLAYLPLVPRDQALLGISQTLELLAGEIEEEFPKTSVTRLPVAGVSGRLVVNTKDALIKIEPNFVFRGALFPAETRTLCDVAQAEFEQFVESRILSVADLYGGKLCAALDRQHPRDLFDVFLMFKRFGLTDEIRMAFTVYLAGHPRPMAEMLNPNEQPLEHLYQSQFAGMARDAVPFDILIETRRRLIEELNAGLTQNERLFLFSMKMGEPEWNRLPIANLESLPALQWKLKNIRSMDPFRRQRAVEKLKQVLNM
jgi:hypothetical protein